MTEEQKNLFKKGSTTYWTSAIFFPKEVRKKITVLYAFVRKADNFVDAIPQQAEAFLSFRKAYETAYQAYAASQEVWESGDSVIDDFIRLSSAYSFDPRWTTAFLDAMESDTRKQTYKKLEETELYMYGSAEVIGLYVSKILGLPQRAYPSAQALGKAMQYINFIRDIKEDLALNRQYLPTEELKTISAPLSCEMSERPEFTLFIREQVARYMLYQKKAEEGYQYIPKRYRIAIKTAADMYKWTAEKIKNDPAMVFTKKVKPPKWLILLTAVKNIIMS